MFIYHIDERKRSQFTVQPMTRVTEIEYIKHHLIF